MDDRRHMKDGKWDHETYLAPYLTVQTCSKKVSEHSKRVNKSVEFRRKTSPFIYAIYRGVVSLPQV